MIQDGIGVAVLAFIVSLAVSYFVNRYNSRGKSHDRKRKD